MYDKILESRKDNATISKSASLQETLHALLITSQELYGVA